MLAGAAWQSCAVATALVLLPGLCLVRAPWPTVPAFSVAFWMVTFLVWPGGGTGRAAFVLSALFVFAVLLVMRLLQRRLWSRPAAADVLLLAGGIVLLSPLAMVPAPLVPDLSFDAAAAQLVAWRDGVPASFEPLIPGQAFPTEALGLQLFAADLAGTAGLAPHRAAFLAERCGAVLLLLALPYAWRRLHGVAFPAGVPAALVVALSLRLTGAWLASSALAMQAGLLVLAASLLVRRTARAATVAGLLFAAAALMVAPAATPLLLAATTAATVYAAGLLLARLGARQRVPLQRAIGAALLAGLAALHLDQRPAFAPRLLEIAAFTRDVVGPMQLICAAPAAAESRWLPALAGRAVMPPPQPARGAPLVVSGRTCSHTYAELAAAAPPR